jgi:hypothetical protein
MPVRSTTSPWSYLSRTADQGQQPGLRLGTRSGALGQVAGVGITLLGITLGSAAVFFGGSLVAGVGFGAGFQAGLRTVLPLATPHKRAGLLSLLYVVSYVGLGLPVVIAGFLIVHGGGVVRTALEYAIAVVVLGALALVLTLRRSQEHLRSPAQNEVMARAGCSAS